MLPSTNIACAAGFRMELPKIFQQNYTPAIPVIGSIFENRVDLVLVFHFTMLIIIGTDVNSVRINSFRFEDQYRGFPCRNIFNDLLLCQKFKLLVYVIAGAAQQTGQQCFIDVCEIGKNPCV